MNKQTTQHKLKIKKDDDVIVLVGKDKGKKGKVLKTLPKENKVIVAGVNEAKRHQKAQAGSQGGIVIKNLPLHVSNVALMDPKDQKAARVGYKKLSDGRKVRFSKRSGEVID